MVLLRSPHYPFLILVRARGEVEGVGVT